MFFACRNTECKQWLCRLGCKPHPTQHTNWVSELINWNRVSTNFWPCRLGVCGFVCVEHTECVLVQFEAHIVVFSSSPPIFLCPPSLSLALSLSPLFLQSHPPSLAPSLPSTSSFQIALHSLLSLSLPVRKKWTIWPLVAAITFSLVNSPPLRLSFHILPGLFSLPAPLFF